MSKLLRYYSPGQIYFVTAVTEGRIPILIEFADELLDAMTEASRRINFKLIAHVIMPDHVHMIIDPGNSNLSGIIRIIKLIFSYNYRKAKGLDRAKVWQSRFWDHIIRNEKDLQNHSDYIHYNPVKHKLVGAPIEWKHSSFHQYLSGGFYDCDWGTNALTLPDGDFGE